MSNPNDLKILISGQLNVGKTIGDINVQLRGIEKRINALKLSVQIDDKILGTMNRFSEQMKRIQGDALQFGKKMEEVTLPDGTKFKTTSFDNLHKSMDSLEKSAKNAKKIAEQMTDATQKSEETTTKLNQEMVKNLQLNKEAITEDQKGLSNLKQRYSDEKKINNVLVERDKLTGEIVKADYTVDHDKGRKIIEQRKKQEEDYDNWWQKALKNRGIKEEQQINEIAQKRASAEKNAIQERLNLEKAQAQAINKTLDDKYKQQQQEKLKTAELQKQLNLYKQQARINVQNLRSDHRMKPDEDALRQYLSSVRQLSVDTPDVQHKMRQMGMEFKKISANAKESAVSIGHHNMSVAEMMRTAMVKFPIWMLSATLFYQPIRQGQALIDTMVQIDTRMVSLRKVMDEDTNFTSMLESATKQAKELGKEITSVLDAYVEFGRQGFNQEQIEELGRVALVASNVGEISAGEAAASLSSTMIQLGMDAKETMSIIDSWNELANNNATEVKKLSDGFSKAASTAKQFGLDMHQTSAVIGTVTAATKQSGREVGNFLKNVLPRLTSQPAGDALEMIGVSLTDSAGDLRDAMDIYEEVAGKFEGLTKMEKAIVAEGLGGKFHISRMTALLTNFDLYNKMLDESRNSSGSALRENNIYMQSLEARINVLKADFQELAIVISDAFMNDSFVSFLEVTTDVTKGITNLITSLGGIPTILLATAPLVMLMNRSLSGWITNNDLAVKSNRTLNQELAKSAVARQKISSSTLNLTKTVEGNIVATERNVQGTRKATLGNSQLTAAQTRLAHSNKVLMSTFSPLIAFKTKSLALTRAKTLSYNMLASSVRFATVAIRGLMSATIVGAGFVAVGYALEKLIAHFGEARRKSEEFQNSQRELIQTYGQNKNEIDKLIKKYEDYESVISGNGGKLSTEQHEEYNSVKQELAQLLPQLVQGESEHGGIILKNTSIIRDNLALLEKRLELERESERLRLQRETRENYQQSLTDYDDNTRNYDRQQRIFGEFEEVQRAYEDAQKRLELADNKTNRQNVEALRERLDGYYELNSAIEMNKLQIEQSAKEMINANDNISNSAKSLLGDFVNLFVSTENDSEKLKKSLDSIFNSLSLDSSNLSNLTKEYGKLIELASKGDLSTEQHEKLKTVIGQITNEVLKLVDAENLSGSTKNKLNSFVMDLINSHGDLSKMQEIVTNYFLDEADAMEDVAQETKKLTELYDGAISSISTLNGFINELNENHKLSADSIGKMIEKYPELLGYMHDEVALIEQIKIKIKEEEEVAKNVIYNKLKDNEQFFNTLLKGNSHLFSELSKYYGVDLSNFKSLAHAKGEVEIKLINELSKKWSQYYNAANRSLTAQGRALEQGVINGQHLGGQAYAMRGALAADVAKVNYEVRNLENAFKDLSFSSAGINFSGIGLKTTPTGGSGSSGSGGSKGSSSASNENTYVTDKYAQALDNLELRIKELQQTQKNYPSTSSQYRKAIQEEIKLHEEKLNLTNNEITRLEKLAGISRSQGGSKNNQELDNLLKDINKLKSTRIDLTQTLLDTRNKIADDLISVMKDAYREKQKIDQEAIRKEMDDLRKAHDEKIKLLDEEMKKYRELYDEKIREIDKQEDDDTYNKQLAEKQKELQKLESEKSLWMMDNSVYGRRMVAETEEQIAKKQLEIEEMIHKRTVDLRKQNLRDELEAKEKQYNLQKETEQTNYETLLEGLENEREALDRHYENILENEREWAKVREDILKGNIVKYSDMLNTFSKEISKNMELLGESVSQNLMDQLRSVRQFLNGISGDMTKVTSNLDSSIPSNNTTSSISSPSTSNNTNTATKSNLPLRKNSAPIPNNLNASSSVTDYLKSKGYHSDFADREALFIHLKGSGKYSGSPAQNDWLLKQLNIIGLRSGGFTGKNEGLAYLHDYEQVLNKNDTKNLFETIKLTDGLMSKLQSFVKRVDLGNLANKTSTSSQVTVHMPVTIQSLNGTKDGANDFLSTINKGMKELGLKLDI